MKAFFHSLQIITLAAWLSVMGFGVAGLLLRDAERPVDERPVMIESVLSPDDFTLGDSADTTSADEPGEREDAGDFAGDLPAPPEIPELTEFAPLPEVPDPPPVAKPRPSQEKPAASGRRARAAQPGASSQGMQRASGGARAGAGGRTGGTRGAGGAARMAGGSMPAPRYPAEARRRGQTGTVVVEFTVDASGRVISARAASPSPWPLLNHEAVRTVRRWKFPAGSVMTLRRPIVFQLR